MSSARCLDTIFLMVRASISVTQSCLTWVTFDKTAKCPKYLMLIPWWCMICVTLSLSIGKIWRLSRTSTNSVIMSDLRFLLASETSSMSLSEPLVWCLPCLTF